MAEGFKERLKEFQCFERRFEVSVGVKPTNSCVILFLCIFKKILKIIFKKLDWLFRKSLSSYVGVRFFFSFS